MTDNKHTMNRFRSGPFWNLLVAIVYIRERNEEQQVIEESFAVFKIYRACLLLCVFELMMVPWSHGSWTANSRSDIWTDACQTVARKPKLAPKKIVGINLLCVRPTYNLCTSSRGITFLLLCLPIIGFNNVRIRQW